VSPARVSALVAAAVLAAATARGGEATSPAPALLVVEDDARGRVLHCEAVTPGATFVLAYTHSSERVPVRGTFRVEPDGALRVVETAFAGFGPGLPELGPGDAWWVADGMIVHRPARHRLPDLRVRVVPLTRHHLVTPSGAALDLSHLMGAGGSLHVYVERAGAAVDPEGCDGPPGLPGACGAPGE
jgi:hypothetical protein